MKQIIDIWSESGNEREKKKAKNCIKDRKIPNYIFSVLMYENAGCLVFMFARSLRNSLFLNIYPLEFCKRFGSHNYWN